MNCVSPSPPLLLPCLLLILLLLCSAFCSSCPPTPTIESNGYLRFNPKPGTCASKNCQRQNSWCLMVLEGCIIFCTLSTTSLAGHSVSCGHIGGGEKKQSWKQWLFQCLPVKTCDWRFWQLRNVQDSPQSIVCSTDLYFTLACWQKWHCGARSTSRNPYRMETSKLSQQLSDQLFEIYCVLSPVSSMQEYIHALPNYSWLSSVSE